MATLQAASEQGEEALDALLLPIEAALSGLAGFDVARKDAARLLQGQPVIIRGRDAPPDLAACYTMCSGQLIALGRVEKGQLLPMRVFNFSGA